MLGDMEPKYTNCLTCFKIVLRIYFTAKLDHRFFKLTHCFNYRL
jgi:hypothetical protein